MPAPAISFGWSNVNNNLELCVLSIDAEHKNHLWLWQNDHYRELAIPAEEGSPEPRTLNDRTEIMGISLNVPNSPVGHGFIWRRGQFEDVTPPAGEALVDVVDMNNRDQVVGHVSDTLGIHPRVWEEGHFFDLPVLPGGAPVNSWNGTEVRAINDGGIAVGYSSDSEEVLHPLPVMWVSRALVQLPLPDNATDGSAYNINNRNHIVGVGNHFSEFPQEVLLWRNGGVEILPLPVGLTSRVEPRAINSDDQIVGFAAGASGARAVLWDHGAAYDLNSLVREHDPLKQSVTFVLAESINDEGVISASANDPTGRPHLYLLIPEG